MSTFKRVNGDYTILTLNGSDSITLDTAVTTVTGDLTVVGNAVLTGNINADRIFYGTSNVEIPAVNGNVTVSVGGTPNVAIFTTAGGNIAGTLDVTGNITGGNISTAGRASVAGNVDSANLNTTGNIVVTRDASVGQPTLRFNDTDTTVADGQILGAVEWYTSDVTGTPRVTSAIRSIASGVAGNANVEILTSTADAAATVKMVVLSTGNVGIANAAPTTTLGVTGTGYFSSTLQAAGNITGGNLLTAGSATATGNIVGGNIATAGLATVTGNITGGNVISLGAVSAGAAGILATGNIDGGNLTTGGAISATGNVTATDYFGSSLSVSGNIQTGTGNISGGNAAITTAITAANIVISGSMSGDGIGVENVIYQSSDVDVSSVTPVTMGSLQFNAVANNAYKFEAWIPVVPDGAMTVAPAVNFSSGSCIYTTETQATATGTFAAATKTTSDDVATTYGMTGTDARTIRITGWFYHTANTTVSMTVQNSTGNLTVKTGSYLSYTRTA